MTSFFKLYLQKTVCIFLIACSISFNIVNGQTKEEKIENLLNLYTEYNQFNGSVLVSEKGNVLYKKGFGYANMEWDISNDPETKHRLGSITKQFTAMLILQLASEGKIDLQAPISKYLPDYPKKNADIITTHHLLTHTSGIPNYTAFPNFFKDESKNKYTPKEFTKTFADSILEFAPGEKFNYSNSGYFVLGLLVETITGKSYEEMLQERIFNPLKMTDTGYDHHETILKNRAAAYEKEGPSYVNAAYIDMSLPYAAGSMYSTVVDLYKWDQALYTETILPKKYIDSLFGKYIPSWENTFYGYGWGIGEIALGNTDEKIEFIGHGGGINGFNTLITRIPSDKSSVILFNNTGGAALDNITKAILGILYNKPYDLPKKSAALSLLNVIQKDGIDAGLKHYIKIKDDKSYNLSENEMNRIGYQLLSLGKLKLAEAVFKLNMDAFPKSFNVYDSYAEVLMKQGQNDLAIKNYKKSIELNPVNENGKEMLVKLGIKTDDFVKEIKIEDSILDSYVGKYELMPNFILTVTKEGSQMKAQATGQPVFDIFPKSENEFYLKVVSALLTFNKDENNDVENVALFQNGQEIIGKKLSE